MKKRLYYFTSIIMLIMMGVMLTQLMFSIYDIFLAPRVSVLDQYQTSNDRDTTIVAKNLSLGQLVERYANVKKELTNLRVANKALDSLSYYTTDSLSFTNYQNRIEVYNQQSDSLANKEIQLEEEIRMRESSSEKFPKILFFWTGGLLLVILGIYSYQKFGQWLGMTMCFHGFVIAMWRAKTWGTLIDRLRSDIKPYDSTMLTLEAILSLITFLLYITLWIGFERSQQQKEI